MQRGELKPMEPVEQLLVQIEEQFQTMTDRVYRERIKGLVPTTEGIVGVPVPKIREFVKEFLRTHEDVTLTLACQLLTKFGERRSREGMLFSTFLLTRFRRQCHDGLWQHIDRWVDMIDNWETCDQMATNLAAEVVFRSLSRIDDLVRWTASPNPWRRRFAAAVTTGLNQHRRSHPLEALRVCENLMRDEEVLVQKAVGWAIREASQRDVAAAFEFLKGWKEKAQPRILREGSQKLPDELRTALLG